jgi:transposase
MKILALDLGKFKSVSCLFDTELQTTEFWTLSTDRPYLTAVLQKYQPELVVIEACSIAAWVHDLCSELGYRLLVCNPNQEAWRWKNVKRKTDHDDALEAGQTGGARAAGRRSTFRPRHSRAPLASEVSQDDRGPTNRVQNILGPCSNSTDWPCRWAPLLGPRSLEAIAAQSRPLADCGLEAMAWAARELAAYHQLHSELAELKRNRRPGRAGRRIGLLETIPGVGRVTAEIIATHLDRPDGSPVPDRFPATPD